jgi:tRNA(Glu) U13 pseudouridine synthase TruD
MKMTYEKALQDFSKLVTVNRDDLDGTIAHLVYRAQHEIDLEDEGENAYIDFVLPKGEYAKLKRFINKWTGK